eukprot:CAMPEP_0176238304 /NCGR_PEP_ID=MMETSP0121_2-20121125/28297_1 /TAXON_ID=160619 /ORGANISM="Kryptoperidinium foliaceum, Strain CCMP 1326" /LENGTH=48 /DNA_ID= /DNA_START= /DNA_END= /DNA_ORIENTATION=
MKALATGKHKRHLLQEAARTNLGWSLQPHARALMQTHILGRGHVRRAL